MFQGSWSPIILASGSKRLQGSTKQNRCRGGEEEEEEEFFVFNDAIEGHREKCFRVRGYRHDADACDGC